MHLVDLDRSARQRVEQALGEKKKIMKKEDERKKNCNKGTQSFRRRGREKTSALLFLLASAKTDAKMRLQNYIYSVFGKDEYMDEAATGAMEVLFSLA